MNIDYLADRPEFIPLLAPDIARHWSNLLPEETVASRTAKLEAHRGRDALPIAWVAHADGEVFGTAALRSHDLDDRPDLSPWLGGVFVRDQYRRCGIATALCRVVEAKAWDLGIETLYLFSIDQQALYSKLGWQVFEHATWRGVEGTIMAKRRAHGIGANVAPASIGGGRR